jgi:hypothetical protein
MKKLDIFYIVVSLITMALYSCSSDTTNIIDDDNNQDDTTSIITSEDFYNSFDDTEGTDNYIENGATHEDKANDYSYNESSVIDITLNTNSITSSSANVTIDGTIATIKSTGTYRISGTLDDGQIIVDSDDEETIKIIFDGININNSTNSPFAIMGAEKTVILLSDNTQNYLTDTSNYIFEDGEDEPDATLFSKDDLTIYGNGTLTVSGNYNEAIKSKDGLVIDGPTINITSVDDGIQGKDYLVIRNGTFTIDVDGDGLKSNNDEDEDLGYIQIDDGDFTIVAEADGLQAETDLILNGGDFDIKTGGGSSASLGEDDSAKAIKGNTSVVIDTGSTITIDAADDGIHSNENIIINGGTFEIASGDDAIHSDYDLTIKNGDIYITKSVEGIEGATITIDGGHIEVVSSDDGINGAGDESGSNYYLYINGGYTYVNASGDGIDVNGYIEMSDGAVIVNGPTGQNNGAIDYDRTFIISGGFLLAVGSSNMVQAPSSSSTQKSILAKFNQTLQANTILHLEKADGTNLFTFAPAKNYQSVVFSSASIASGSSYKLYTGGSCNGNSTNGLYTDGTYTYGALTSSFTVSNTITNVN